MCHVLVAARNLGGTIIFAVRILFQSVGKASPPARPDRLARSTDPRQNRKLDFEQRFGCRTAKACKIQRSDMEMKAGFAQSVITPQLPIQLAGHRGPRLDTSLGDDLLAKAMVCRSEECRCGNGGCSMFNYGWDP